MNSRRIIVALAPMLTYVCTGIAQDSLRWRIEAGFTYSHFQQQVKAEVGDPRGERLSYELQFGVMTMGTYQVWDYTHVGLFLQFDRGNRLAARFAGFDTTTGRTVTREKHEGSFSEFWFGPFVRGQWKYFFGEAGWGLFGVRTDGLRTDLPSETGDTTGTFDLLPSVAFFGGLGAAVPFNEQLSLVFRFEYRLRYYKGREGKPFQGNFEHGTQNVTPFIGVSWMF
jgi:hypothetical protein